MPGERDAENLRVALMSYDDRELRIRKFYLEEQSTIIRCTCFQSGEPVLQALRQERCFDVLVLSSQLEDMDSLTFLEKLNRLPSHPPLLLQGDGWADDITAAHLQPGSRFYGVGHDHLRDLLRGLLGVPGRNSMQIERFCTPPVRAVEAPAAGHQLRIPHAGGTDRLFSRWKTGAPQRDFAGRRGTISHHGGRCGQRPAPSG